MSTLVVWTRYYFPCIIIIICSPTKPTLKTNKHHHKTTSLGSDLRKLFLLFAEICSIKSVYTAVVTQCSQEAKLGKLTNADHLTKSCTFGK